ncbi:MAG: SagB/ThcOx family dehydrogenase [Variovorax sp.]|nr:MAG: SagB/ThcOx family dehydrogenase [Variovorax sp.]
MPKTSHDDAPLFQLFWDNSVLNPTRVLQLAERIGHDAAQAYVPHRPLHTAAAEPLPPADSAIANVHARRRSGRAFGTAALDARSLSNLLRPFAAHTSAPASTRLLPSGGGKYPVLVYAALYRVTKTPALDGRIAWYDPASHGLVPTALAPAWPVMAKALGVDWPEPPAAVFLLAGRAEGSLRKYGERGGRFLLLEAGAYMGALGLQVAEAGLSGTAIASFLDADLLRAFGLQGSGQLAVLAYACGSVAPV